MNPDSMSEPEENNLGEKVKMPLRIMLLGKSGVGKSSSGNTILGKQVFESDMKLTTVTQQCDKETETVGDMLVSVIDTPGFFEKDGDQKKTIREILQSVKLLEQGPHAFVYVVPIGRLTQEDQSTHNVIETMFGPKVWDFTIVLFTHGDRLEGKTINDIICQSDDNLRNFLRKCSGGFHVFNNKNQDDLEQVISFLAKIQTLVTLNGGIEYHKELYPTEVRKIRERQEVILMEKDEEISRMERQLEEHCKGDELEKYKKMLWRKEENKAWLAAEEETGSRNIWPLLLLTALLLIGCAFHPVMCLALGGVIIIWIRILLKEARGIYRKVPWHSNKTK